AGGCLVTRLAALAIVAGALCPHRLLVRIVATAAPEAGSAGPLAGALHELFIVAGWRQLRLARVRAGEHRHAVAEQISWRVRTALADPCYAGRASEVTLRANAVSAGWV